MGMTITLETALSDKDGRAIGPWKRLATNSWTKAASQILRVFLSQTTDADVDDTGNVARSVVAINTTKNMKLAAAITDATFGIQVGTSATAVTRDDYALTVLVAHGVAATQLEYGTCVVSDIVAVSGGYKITVSRVFTNNSGGNITVKEIGLVAEYNGGTSFKFLIAHDLTGDIVVTNTLSRTFRYVITVLVGY